MSAEHFRRTAALSLAAALVGWSFLSPRLPASWRTRTDQAGSGLHLNLSVADDAGRNGFADPGAPHGLARAARHAIAGILAHYPALCAIAAPTVNAYKRLTPGAIGASADWGLDHRLAAVRVPGERGPATRLEFRVADGTASPHLLSAAILFAALLGIRDELALPEPRTGEQAEAAVHAPRDLTEALELLEKDTELIALLDPDLVRTYLGLKRWECEQWSRAVTDWEIGAYGRHF